MPYLSHALMIILVMWSGHIVGHYVKYRTDERFRKYSGIMFITPLVYLYVLFVASIDTLKEHGIFSAMAMFWFTLTRYPEFAHMVICLTRVQMRSKEEIVTRSTPVMSQAIKLIIDAIESLVSSTEQSQGTGQLTLVLDR